MPSPPFSKAGSDERPPAKRGANGHLLHFEIERLRDYIRKGVSTAQICQNMQVSDVTVHDHRRRMAARGEVIGPSFSEQQKVDLQWLWLQGWPIEAAADEVRIPHRTAYRVIDVTKHRMAAERQPLPVRLPPGARPKLADRHAASDKPASPPTPIALVEPRPTPRKRAPSLEEQLARIAAGARLIPTFKPTRPTIDATLGGVGSALL